MDKIDELLTRGVANMIPGKDELKKALESGKKLNIYLGLDPTATKIHLGHAVPLRKLQSLAELGHNVTFLIGDFTALIGDTSDKDTERPVLTPEEIQENFKTYKEQAEKIMDFSKVKIRHNSEWLGKLGFKDIIELTQKFSLNDFISRELIRKRLDDGKRVRLDETMYPLMQGYDSYFMDTDLQVGGTDQTFNMQAGRTLQKLLRNKDTFVLSTPFLEGTDGRKMSKSWGNAIWLNDAPNEMYGKVMSLRDDLITQYYTLATDVALEEIEEIKKKLESGENPMKLKKDLAFEIVSELHSKQDAEKASQEFETLFQKHDFSSADIPVTNFHRTEENTLNICDLLVKASVTPSKSEAKRLIEQGAIEIDDKVITNPGEVITLQEGLIIKAGKKTFVKISYVD